MGLFYYTDMLGQRCGSVEHPVLMGISVEFFLEGVIAIKLVSPAGTSSAKIVLTVDELQTILTNIRIHKTEG